MDKKHLSWFKVENFKRFDSLEVKDIGQFNLIVGDNNVGKTTLLEALLFDDENYDQFLINLEFSLENREIYPDSKKINYIDFFTKSNSDSIAYHYQLATDTSTHALIITKKDRSGLSKEEIEDFYVQLKLNDSPYIVQLENDGKIELKIIESFEEKNKIRYHFPFLSSKIYYDEEILDFSFSISVSNKKLEIFKKELKDFLPNLVSIEVSNSAIPGDDVIIIREANSDKPLPIAAYGDGFIKLFRCLLKLELSQNKRLMIDEIGAGIHYGRMKDFFIKVLESAKNKNVQIFATTHSKECIEYYTKALEELGYEKDGRIIRLADTKSGKKAYTMRFEEFENSLFAESEIR